MTRWGVEHFCDGVQRVYPTLHWADEPEVGAGPRQAFECDACGERYVFRPETVAEEPLPERRSIRSAATPSLTRDDLLAIAAIQREAYQNGVHDASIDAGYHNDDFADCTNTSCIESYRGGSYE